MLKKSTLSLFALLVALLLGHEVAWAQTPTYGNEWIQTGQSYWKLRVNQRGIHRLSAAWLTAAGLPVSTLDPRRIQLWRRGREQAIYVAGQTDGRFDATDYIDFWGLPNDGRLDAELFKNPAEQISHLSPIYSDTAAYFLTVSPSQNGLRMPELTSTTTGLTPRRYHMAEVIDVHRNNYYIGRDYGQIYLPWFDGTEGYFGAFIGVSPNRLTTGGGTTLPDPTFTLPQGLDTTQLQPTLEITVIGCGFDASTFELRLMRGTSTNPTVIRTVGPFTVTSFGRRTVQIPVRYADFNVAATGSTLRCRVAVTNNNVATPFLAVAYGKLRVAGRNNLNRLPLLVSTDSTAAGASQYLLFDTPPPRALAYDVTNPDSPTRIQGQTTGQQWGVVVPTLGGTTRKVFIAKDDAPIEPAAGVAVRFRGIQPRPNLYVILTGEQLLADSVGNRPVRDYANYRASAAGGQHDTLVVTVQQLYDLYMYGDKSPVAVRRFLSYLGASAGWPNYMFVIGKGYQPVHLGSRINVRRQMALDIVPSPGTPGTDVLYSADFRNNQMFPRVPTGRLAAVTPADVTAYLTKAQQHDALGTEPWRKEILHLGGGKTNGEQRLFADFLNDFARRAEDTVYFGGNVTSILRGNSGSYVTNVDVSSQVNQGLAMITFFGHSSTSVSDIDVGLASNPISNYNNTGRYPVMLMNGCASGNAFFPGQSFGEDWVMARNRGAIAFLAHSGEGAPTYLRKYSSTFYATAFNDPNYYGQPLGRIQQQTIRRCTDSLSLQDPLAVAQLTEMQLQGDPAIRFFSPDKPDYSVDDAMLSLRPFADERITARADSFQIVIKVRNLGKATNDRVRVQVRRTIGGATTTSDDVFRPIFYGDTIFFKVRNLPGQAVQGLNRFDVFVDWPDSVAEMNENNNRATLTFNMPAGSVFPLFPPEFAIVNTTQPSLYGQYDQPLTGTRPYTFELDTVPTFRSSGTARQTATITGGRYPLWQPTLPVTRDSLVWYWRFKPQNLQPGEDTTWATSSFRYIAGTRGGWSQSHYGQFARDKKTTIRQAVPSGKWSYSPTTLRLELRTVTGAGTGINDTITFDVPPNGIVFNQSNRVRNNCGASVPNLAIMVFDPRTFEPLSSIPGMPGGGRRMRCGQEGNPDEYVVFQGVGDTILPTPTPTNPQFGLTRVKGTGTNRVQYFTARADTLANLINAIPNGYIVAVLSMNRVPFELMRARKPGLVTAIQTLGSSLITSLRDGDPFLLVGVKGSAPGTATESTYDPSLPRARQQVKLTTTKVSNLPEGRITSTEVGPAQRWDELFYTLKPVSATSRYDLRIVPISATGQAGPPVPVTAPSNTAFPISGIDAQQYPKLRLELFSQDTISRQAPQLKQWLVTYQTVPEGVVRADMLQPAQLDLTRMATDSGYVALRVPFQNISSVPFGAPIVTDFTIDGNALPGPVQVTIPALAPNALGYIRVKIPVGRFASGTYVLRANVNPNGAQPEQYLFNNTLEASFRIENPNMAPLVDVAFDGRHILYGDIVAPAPTINIAVKDEDKNQPLDPQNVTIVLTRPGQTQGVQIPVSPPQVEILPATATKPLELVYRPGRLDDGVYKLEVNARDAAGNSAGDAFHPYRSEFRVINETMISNFYPYPNPFSTSTRFLFTITGKVPQSLKVQIMTVTGKVVRELTKEDLGTDLRVGNNTSAATWDGTDEYGDKLANGVYLYRVVVQDEADNFKSFKTAGDQKAFNKGWGKLYILR